MPDIENARCCYWCKNNAWVDNPHYSTQSRIVGHVAKPSVLSCDLDGDLVPSTGYCGNWEEPTQPVDEAG